MIYYIDLQISIQGLYWTLTAYNYTLPLQYVYCTYNEPHPYVPTLSQISTNFKCQWYYLFNFQASYLISTCLPTPPPFPSKPTPRLRFHTYFPYRRIHSNLTERVNIIVIRLYNRDNTYILNMFHHSYNLMLMSNLRIQFIYINSK